MSIIVKFDFAYWADGTCHDTRLEEYDSVQEAIDDLGSIAWNTAIDDVVTVQRTIPEGHVGEIAEGIQLHIGRERAKARRVSIRQTIADDEKWLASMEEEREKREVRLALKRAELEAVNKVLGE